MKYDITGILPNRYKCRKKRKERKKRIGEAIFLKMTSQKLSFKQKKTDSEYGNISEYYICTAKCTNK